MIDFDKRWGKYLNEVTIFEPDPISLPSFEVKDMLNPVIWGEDGQLQPEIQEKLLKIANDFIEDAELGVAVRGREVPTMNIMCKAPRLLPPSSSKYDPTTKSLIPLPSKSPT